LEPRQVEGSGFRVPDSGISDATSNRETDPCLWSPGIKLGVKPGSWFHQTECFGPVLGVMRAENLKQAVEWQNATDYGLTAGLHSLDPKEHAYWREHVQAGNLYINRATTGAIVQRQPFGGWKRSCIGPGAKAGGPNYVLSFCYLSDSGPVGLKQVEENYIAAKLEHTGKEHDPSGLHSESNVFRYRPSRGVIVRVAAGDQETIKRIELAGRTTGVSYEIVTSDEGDESFIARLPELAKRAEFFRTVNGASERVLAAVHEGGLNWIDAPVTACGRIELRNWMREQAVTTTLHRYGQLAGTRK
jgi:RHH-type proline utilization regulon transcriptional repressor/proline dehydrogenase/delta 1-pyrroline-5-carboxylate dehydrogenase